MTQGAARHVGDKLLICEPRSKPISATYFVAPDIDYKTLFLDIYELLVQLFAEWTQSLTKVFVWYIKKYLSVCKKKAPSDERKFRF